MNNRNQKFEVGDRVIWVPVIDYYRLPQLQIELMKHILVITERRSVEHEIAPYGLRRLDQKDLVYNIPNTSIVRRIKHSIFAPADNLKLYYSQKIEELL